MFPGSAGRLQLLRRRHPAGRVDRRAAARTPVLDEFGWAKTYDAQYVALARILACRLVTLDGRLRCGTERLGFVVGPAEI